MRPPDRSESAAVVDDALAAVAHRLRSSEILRTLAVALSMSAVLWPVLVLIGAPPRAAAVLVTIGGIVLSVAWLVTHQSRWSHAAAALAIERVCPLSRNVVITAEELLRHPQRVRPWVLERVLERAAGSAAAVDRSAVRALGRDAGLAILAAVVAAIVAVGVPQRMATSVRQSAGNTGPRSGPPGAAAIEATITPPAYTRESPRTLQNPDRIEALQGSQLQLAIRGGGSWRARFGTRELALRSEEGRSVFNFPLHESGYLAIESAGADATADRRLVPISVAADRAPSIRISVPARDLLLPDAKETIGIEASADDDFGLRSLDLRYTRVSGTGEQFEFQEGSIPLAVTPVSDRAWNARGRLTLPSLALAPGDSIIYRIVGRDWRPGDAGQAASDTYFIEIAGPGQVALEGFEMPPDRERYALSQQMIVLKLERLRTRERSLDRAKLEQEIGNIAAEQRAVRANFVFLTGGHVEDEEEEAAHSNEIQEGRLENTARREIVAAIQHMSRAEQGMAAVNTGAALPPARAAVEALQRAFGRNRYFLRTVPVRSRIDPSRRLSGETSSAADWRRELFPVRLEGPEASARAILSRLLELSPEVRSGSLPPAALTAVAEQAIAVDPSSPEWQAIARNLLQLRDNLKGEHAARSTLVNGVVGAIAAVVQRTAMTVQPVPTRDGALRSAWAEERR